MSDPTLLQEPATERRYWFSYVNRYQWYVLILCALGWMFDCADQMIFTLSRSIAMRDLMRGATEQEQTSAGTYATMLFMIGWATGGLVFGIIGDKWGRAKTMGLTVFLYAMFTGLSALSHNWIEFAISRFVTGFGVGGEFAAGAALVADVMPREARAMALGLLQALSAIGNIAGAEMLTVVTRWAGSDEHLIWRYLYLVGAIPAIIAVFMLAKMKEPDKWVEAKKAAKASGVENFGRITDLFTDPRWRRNTIVGLLLAISGVIGVWGILFYSPELIDSAYPPMTMAVGDSIKAVVADPLEASRAHQIVELVQTSKIIDDKNKPTAAALSAKSVLDGYRMLLSRTASYHETVPSDLISVSLSPERKQKLNALLSMRIDPKESAKLKSNAAVIQQFGAFFGMLGFSILAVRIGRRPTFVIAFFVAWASIWIVFLGFHDRSQIWYLWPFMGFCTLLPFGGYAVYFPEIFPTRLRTTGTGFCYNVGRYISSLGPIMLGALEVALVGRFNIASIRVAAVIVASVYLVGIVAALFGPETKDQPLPEDAYGTAH
jgi:MFS family permease